MYPLDGPNLAALANELWTLPSVEQIAVFGDRLHVVGRDRERLAADLAPWRAHPRYRWEPVEPGLEDVLIHLMRTANQDAGGDAR